MIRPSIQYVSLVLMALMIAIACSKREPHKVMKEYEIWPALNEVRLCQYHRYPENDTMFILFRSTMEQGILYVTESAFTNTTKISERKLRIANGERELVGQWYYLYPDPSVNSYDSIVAEIIDYTVVDDGKRFPGGQYYFRYKLPDNMVTGVKINETFERDTIYAWNGEIVPAIKFKDEYIYETSHRFMPFMREKIELKGAVYFAKNIGVVHFFAHGDMNYTYELFKVDVYKEGPLVKWGN